MSSTKKNGKKRKEMDTLGSMSIPREAYTGIFYSRAKENFSLSTRKFPPLFFHQLALLKHVNALEHVHAKRMDPKIGNAIVRATKEIMDGKYDSLFDLDVFEAGAGTPLNMTMNEVVTNRALEILGERKGKYARIHPNNHVNMMQSTNDVVPTAIRLTCLVLSEKLEKELIQTIHVTEELSKKYAQRVKTGRTHLQTAVPVTFGGELYTYAQSLRESLLRIREAREGLYELQLGGTAVGTGITTVPGYDVNVVKRLKQKTGLPFYPSHRKMFHTSHMSVFSHYSSALSQLASELLIWANDWILLSSDTYAGIGEIKLPEVEPGSSIMPGKINPSILEAMKMVTLQVQGNHETIRLSCESTQLELNVMTPVLASNLFESQEILANALRMFREKCVRKITPNVQMTTLLERGNASATALNPYLGYEVVSHYVKKSLSTGKMLSTLLTSEKILLPEEVKLLMKPEHVTRPTALNESLREKIHSRPSYRRVLAQLQKFSR